MIGAPGGFVHDIARERRALRAEWAAQGLHAATSIPDAVVAGLASNHGFLAIHANGELTEISAEALHHEALHLASALEAHGIGRGDVVAMQLPNWIEATSLLLAIIYAGAIVLPIVPIYGPKEVAFILRQARAKAMFVPDVWNNVDYVAAIDQIDDLPHLALKVAMGERAPAGGMLWSAFRSAGQAGYRLPTCAADELCLLLYTSGTTSDPKGVLHTHQTVQAAMANMQSPRKQGQVYRALTSPSTGHIGHVMQALLVMLMAGEAVSMERWSPNIATMLIERYGSERMDAAPVFIHSLLEAARADSRDISSLTDVKMGGTAIMPSDIEAWAAVGISAFRAYGSTEHPLATNSWPHDPVDIRAYSDGYASPGTRIRTVDGDGQDVAEGQAGEIAIVGPQQFIGYHDPALNADHFLQGGWFLTGDIGVLNADGSLVITDRKKDVIIRGGENISAKEVEETMARLPWVVECAAVSMPDARLGEKVCVFAMVRDRSAATMDNIRDHFRAAGIAKPKTPEAIVVVEQFPRTASGKIKKYELRTQIREMMLSNVA